MSAQEFCENCKYFRSRIAGMPEGFGECRAQPPQALMQGDTQSRRAQFRLTWPRVKRIDWCGVWAPRA